MKMECFKDLKKIHEEIKNIGVFDLEESENNNNENNQNNSNININPNNRSHTRRLFQKNHLAEHQLNRIEFDEISP